MWFSYYDAYWLWAILFSLAYFWFKLMKSVFLKFNTSYIDYCSQITNNLEGNALKIHVKQWFTKFWWWYINWQPKWIIWKEWHLLINCSSISRMRLRVVSLSDPKPAITKNRDFGFVQQWWGIGGKHRRVFFKYFKSGSNYIFSLISLFSITNPRFFCNIFRWNMSLRALRW